jgi:signal peptidase I
MDDAPPEEPITGAGTDDGGKKHRSFLMEVPVLVVIALVVALLVKGFVAQAFVIPSTSMVPTLEVGDRVLVNKLAPGQPGRGDVVVFHNPRYRPPDRGALSSLIHWLGEGVGLGQGKEEYLVKRVIGLPGETVTVKKDGVYIDGRRLDEPYANVDSGSGPLGTWEVPEARLFMMGDNRGGSEDSR